MLTFKTNNRAICVSCFERRHCETLLSHCWTHRTSPRGWTPPSQISPITVQRRSVYDNDSFRYITTGADSEQPVGALCYQWAGCRDHAGIACFPHSGSCQAQGGPAYICRDQRKMCFSWYGTFKYCCQQSLTVMFDTFEILNLHSQSVIYQVLSQVCGMCVVSLTFSSLCQCFH